MTGMEVLLAPLQGLLGYFQKERHASSEEDRYAEAQRQEALQAMYVALVATKKYQESSHPHRDKELELSQFWATAAIKSRKYLKEASAMNYDKARYWLEQLKWPEQTVKAKGIDLTTVEARIRELLDQE